MAMILFRFYFFFARNRVLDVNLQHENAIDMILSSCTYSVPKSEDNTIFLNNKHIRPHKVLRNKA